ncbi:hypothetical protein REPUB_Repub07fG0118500 [Reevesia pubescens]
MNLELKIQFISYFKLELSILNRNRLEPETDPYSPRPKLLISWYISLMERLMNGVGANKRHVHFHFEIGFGSKGFYRGFESGNRFYAMVLHSKESTLLAGNAVEDDDVMDDLSGEESESGSESEQEDVKLAEPSKNSIYNRDGLMEKLQDISWPENVEWMHKLSLDIDQEKEVDVNDDLERELALYTQALEGTRLAFEKFQSMGLPFLRPPDYYAEMAKSDAHMQKVKGKLLAQKRQIEEAEERRKAREAKKIAKEVQAEKLKERAKQKKQEFESVKKWRKQRQQSGFPAGGKDSELDFSFEDGKAFERSSKKRPGVTPGDRSGGKAKQGGGKGKNMKNREFRNSKFGFGGRKGLKKQNTSETTNDFRGFKKGDVAGNKKRKR